MKKLMYFMIMAVAMLTITSCDKTNGGGDDITPTKKYRVKKMTFEWNWSDLDPAKAEFESWTYEYDKNGRVTKVVNAGEDWSEDMVFDYSVEGQVTVKRDDPSKTKVWKLNSNGYVSEIVNIWNDGGNVTFDYDANGFMLKAFEVYDNTPELKSTFTITNGNTVSFTRGERVKNFTFSSGENMGNIYQTVNDSFITDWQAQTGLFGKANKNLNTKVQWSDSDKVTEIGFDFYEDGRVLKAKRSGADWFENYVYEYEEVVE